VMASVDVYTYFLTMYKPPTLSKLYPDGVYRVNTEVEKVIGSHAVILHGWGKSYKGVQYYEGRNSWGSGWGKIGLFRVKMHSSHVIKEVMYQSYHAKEEIVHSECVSIDQDGDTKSCTFKNSCKDKVQMIRYSFLGLESNCGRWEVDLPALFPGTVHTQSHALFCQIITEQTVEKYTPFDSRRYYVDVSAENKPYPCVLKNTWSGEGARIVCCGDSCVETPPNTSTAFDETFCSDEVCAASGVGNNRFEKIYFKENATGPAPAPASAKVADLVGTPQSPGAAWGAGGAISSAGDAKPEEMS